MPDEQEQYKRQWRDYRTASGARPVNDFINQLSPEDMATVKAAMNDVAREGLIVARHIRGEIYEVRANGSRQSFRILFATEGRFQHVLLSLEGFSKKTQKTPQEKIELAERRLRDWRRRGVGEKNKR
ncbi:MAG TPA: type II toxin-antitoxin system RelE/ParE family toxin [Ktedonobacterales bacterium]|jgi:phage-related protein